MPTVALRGGYQAGQECRWAADKDEVTVVGYTHLPDGRHVTCFSGRKGHALRVLCVLVVFSVGLVTGLVVKRLNTDPGAVIQQDDFHQVHLCTLTLGSYFNSCYICLFAFCRCPQMPDLNCIRSWTWSE